MRQPVRYENAGAPVREPVTKLGGQPVWLTGPQWPLSRSLRTPMEFIGQFELTDPDAAEVRLAYVFMTDHFVDGAWEPTGGENAVIIQPGGRVPAFVDVAAVAEVDHDVPDRVPVAVPPTPGREPWEFIGGDPHWMQGDETPEPGWRLIMQLTDAYGHNFGDAGIGYAFLSPDGCEGRFLWQCA